VALGILKKMGLKADAVADGKEALASLAVIPYDLVLMDVQMPEMDGIEATRQIRDNGSVVLNHGVPIIAMTAHSMVGDRERCLQAGMNGYISKPVEPEALARALDQWLPLPRDVFPGNASSGAKLPGHRKDEVSPVPDPAIWDKNSMMRRLLQDEDLAQLSMLNFLEDFPKQAGVMREHWLRRDASAVELFAHKIKGAAANMSCPALYETAAEIEEAAKSGALDPSGLFLDELMSRFARVREAMEIDLRSKENLSRAEAHRRDAQEGCGT